MKKPLSLSLFAALQLCVLSAFGLAYFRMSDDAELSFRKTVLGQSHYPEVPIPRDEPLTITPLYDDPSVVSDEDLARVLKKIRPKFPARERKPNYVEHALRAWSVDATFTDPAVMSGEEMRDFLLDHSRYAASWSNQDSPSVDPILIDRPRGVAVNWQMKHETSVHHDHLLASLSEAGVSLDQRVFPPSGRNLTFYALLQEALRDFEPDEKETEWSTMAFAMWLPPVKSWRTQKGRTVTFDMLAERLMRGQKEIGVCSGTHRVYSLMLLWRLDQTYDIITDQTSERIIAHLKSVRDLIMLSQFPDGHWPANWPDGAEAVSNPLQDEPHRAVIATGHHLEWLAIAPPELHPPREVVQRAARWLIDDTTSQTDEYIFEKYTFYSHVGNALALWRKTHPADFWREWTSQHPDFEMSPSTPAPDAAPARATPPVVSPNPE